MAYATIDNMLVRFGAVELTRLTTPADLDMDGVVADVANAALDDATAFIDSYLRGRYNTPLDVPPPEVVAKCCDIARYNLSTGDGKTCSEEVRLRHKDALGWLGDIARGTVKLELDEVPSGGESFAMVSEGRRPMFGGW